MAIRRIAELKSYFEKGDRPTQAQFADLIDTTLNVLTISLIAGAILGGQRLVMLSGGQAVYFDSSFVNDVDKIVGLTNQSANTGEPIDVVTSGLIESQGWGLITDSIYYAGSNGVITTIIPTNGVYLKIGKAIDSHTLLIEFSEPIILA